MVRVRGGRATAVRQMELPVPRCALELRMLLVAATKRAAGYSLHALSHATSSALACPVALHRAAELLPAVSLAGNHGLTPLYNRYVRICTCLELARAGGGCGAGSGGGAAGSPERWRPKWLALGGGAGDGGSGGGGRSWEADSVRRQAPGLTVMQLVDMMAAARVRAARPVAACVVQHGRPVLDRLGAHGVECGGCRKMRACMCGKDK